jgi:opacity protein-like surface antigen
MKTLLAAAVSAVLLASGTLPALAQTVGQSAPHKATPNIQIAQDKGKSAESKGKAETKGVSAEKGKAEVKKGQAETKAKAEPKAKAEEKGKK